MPLKNQNILIISNEPWGDLWYSKQNYAYELSKKNKVIFINPCEKWSFKNLFTFNVNEGFYSASLSYVNYTNFLPAKGKLLDLINNYITSKRLKNWLQNSKKLEHYIFWSFDPIRLYNHKLLGAKTGIFHCVDYYLFKFRGEKIICKNSDIIFATSQRYLDEYNEFKKPKYVVPHGISEEEFTVDKYELESVKKELIDKGVELNSYALFIGVIDFRLDFSTTEEVIKAFPNTQFVFIGPLKLPKNQTAHRIFIEQIYPNVVLLGAKHFKALKNYIYLSKFCFSFMDMNHKANTVHHHKTLVYLAQGKPVFSPTFSEYASKSDIMYMDNATESVITLIDKFLKNGESESKSMARIDYAKTYTFENILKNAESVLARENLI